MAAIFDDAFADPTRPVSGTQNGLGFALPKSGNLDTLGLLSAYPSYTQTPDSLDDVELPQIASTGLTDPFPGQKEPTAFQQRKINWADGGPKPTDPIAYDVPSGADFLEVDYQSGRKEGSGNSPVLAANVFGRQFTREQLERDDEGRRLLDLMETRRRGDMNAGGSIANFARGFTDWSTSDIPFYGWVSDIGATAGEAIDIAKTMRKLQDGEKVTAHEAIQARRFMLQQELEGTRTMAYNVGSITRQAVPFMAEMFMTSLVTATVAGAASGGLLAVPGAIVGAAMTPLRWALGIGKAAAKAGGRKVVNSAMANIAAKAVGDITATEFASVARAGISAYGAAGYREILREMAAKAARELGEGAARAGVRRLARKFVADELQYARKFTDPTSLAARTLFSADYRLSLESAIREGAERMLLGKVGYDAAKHGTSLAVRDRLLKSALPKAIQDGSWAEYVKGISEGMLHGAKMTGTQLTRQGLTNTTGSWIPSAYAKKVTQTVARDVVKNIELRFGEKAFATPERLYRYFAEHAMRGLFQTPHSLGGVGPTLAQSGFSTFNRCSDALKEGLGRVFIEAPIRAATQVGIQLPLGPLFAVAHGKDPTDVTYKGQLGKMATALMTGDRDNMESARMTAIGSMFVEYMSENAGRGLGLTLGGAIGGAMGKTTKAFTSATRDTFVTPITRRAGSLLDKAVEASFGTNPFKDGTEKLIGYGVTAVNKWARKANLNVPEAEVRRVFTTKSLDGISDNFRATLESKGIKGYSGFKYAVANDARNNRRAHALMSYIGATLMERGATPDKVVALFRQGGYDGILEEMGEERLGDFVRGLFHFDDTASDADIKTRIKSMFHGFTDFEQLAAEFIGFAIPGGIRRAAIGSQQWLASGTLADLRNRAASFRSLTDIPHRGPVSVVAVNRASDADAVREKQVKSAEMKEQALRSTEENHAAFTANAANILSDVNGTYDRAIAGIPTRGDRATRTQDISIDAHATAVHNVMAGAEKATPEEMARRLSEFADDLVTMPNEQELESAIELRGAVHLLGVEGVDAVRREWRKREGNEFSDPNNSVEQSLSEWKAYEATPVAVDRTPLTADEAARTIYAQVETAAADQSITREQTDRASTGAVSTLVDAGVRDTAVEDAMELIRYMGRAQNHMESKMGWGRRALSRAIGILGATATGDLSLAVQNPAMWLAHDQGLDKHVFIGGLFAYNAGLLAGFKKLLPTFTEDIRTAFGQVNTAEELRAAMAKLAGENKITGDLYDQIEEAGRETFERRTREFVTDYLAATGLMLTTREDVGAMALRVAESRGDGDVESARNDIIDGIFELSRHSLGYSTHTQQGRGTSVTIDVTRALKSGTKQEVIAAIMASPAYRNVARVANVSGMSEADGDTVFSSLFSDSADLDRVLDMDIDNLDVDERAVAEVMQVLHRDVSDYTPDELQDLVKGFIRKARLVREGIATSYTKIDDTATRTAEILPVGAGSFVVRITSNGTVESESQHASFSDARAFVDGEGFTPDNQKLVVTHVTQFASQDATSLLLLHYGNDRDALRDAYIRNLGDQYSEDMLPPICRKVVRDMDRGSEYEFTPEVAVTRFKEELALAREYADNRDNLHLYLPGSGATNDERKTRRDAAMKAYRSVVGVESSDVGYESRAEQMLNAIGVRRNASSSGVLNNIGLSENAFVMRADAISHRNTLVISPDYATAGHGEAMLRHGIRQALNMYVVAGPDLDLRRELLVETVREFRECGKTLAEGLRSAGKTEEARRIVEVLDTSFPLNMTGVTTDELSAIASSSIFFSCDRGTYEEGNGFLRSTEVAMVADLFRTRPIFPIFMSAVDEALGGVGLFHVPGVTSNRGLGRYIPAFKPAQLSLANARKSTAFGGDSGVVKHPFITGLRFKSGTTKDAIDSDAAFVEVDESVGAADASGDMRDTKFDGDITGYIKRVGASLSAFTDLYMKTSGSSAQVLSAAQAFRMARNANLCGGNVTDVERETMPLIEEHDRHVRTVAKNAVASAGVLTAVDGVTDETAQSFGAALRTVFDLGAWDRSLFIARMKKFLTVKQAPANVVTEFISAFEDSSVTIQSAEDEAADMIAAETAITEELERDEATNDPDHERRTAEFTTSQDVAALSGVVRWVFPGLNGNESSTMLMLRSELASGRLFPEALLQGLDPAAAKDISDLVEALRVNERLDQFNDALATSVFASADPVRIERVLDNAITLLARERHYGFAIALAAIRNIPDRNGRRSKLLSVLAQATPIDPLRLDRKSAKDPFSVSPLGTKAQDQATPVIATVAYTSLALTPMFTCATGSKHNFELLAAVIAGFHTKNGPLSEEVLSKVAAPVTSIKLRGVNRPEILVAMTKEEYRALMEVREGKFPEDLRAFSLMLDKLQTEIAGRMAAMADVYDKYVRPGSMVSFMLRDGGALAVVRQNVESAAAGKIASKPARYMAVDNFINFANYFVAHKVNRKSTYSDAMWGSTSFLADFVEEPLEGLFAMITGQALQNLPPHRRTFEFIKTALESAHAKRPFDVEFVQNALTKLAFMKVRTGMHVDRGTDVEKAYSGASGVWTPGARRTTTAMKSLIDAFVWSRPRSAATLGGRSASLIEAAKNRSVQTLPSQLPGFVRFVNSEFAQTAGIKDELLSNGGKWLDGTNPLVSFVGAKDADGSLLPKETLAGIVDSALTQGQALSTASHFIFPFFRADKPSCYALRMPARVVEALVAKGTDSLDTLPDNVRAIVEKYDPKDSGSLYSAGYAMAAMMLGQSLIDPKRVPVLSSVGPFIAPYGPDKTGNVPPEAGLYIVSTVGGKTGASLMGGYNLLGVLASRVSALMPGSWSEAQKLHMFNAAAGVNFKKGQAMTRVLRDVLTGGTTLTSGAEKHSFDTMLRTIEKVCGLKKGVLAPLLPREEKQPWAEYNAYVKEFETALSAAEEFLKYATVMGDDLETNKAGLFGSSCGFSDTDETGAPLTELVINGVQVLTRDASGGWVLGKDVPAGFELDVTGEIKNGQIPIMMAVSAYTAASGESIDVTQLDAVWRRPDHTVFKGKLSDSGLLSPGEKLDAEYDQETGAARFTFFTRAMLAQIVASNSSPSSASYAHVFPTNATRDHWLLESINSDKKSARFINAHSAYSMLQLMDIDRNPWMWADRVLGDQELADLVRKHPNDNDVRDMVSSRIRAFYSKQMIVPFYGNHGIMVPSGGKVVEKDEFRHLVKTEWAPGTTQYDKDCYRRAPVYISGQEVYYGRSRGWGSGAVNARVKGFRYGLYMDDAAFDKLVSVFEISDELAKQMRDLETVERVSHEEARRAVLLEVYIKLNMAKPEKMRQLLGCFTDYTGRKASETWSAGADFSDLWIQDINGNTVFDRTAIGIGKEKRTAPDGTVHIYLAGTPFHGHRSPSGNIAAASGTVRATCPRDFNSETGQPGATSMYALDPVTTDNQGSDDDGDSASLQYRDSAATAVTDEQVRDFVEGVSRGTHTVYDRAKELGWLETLPTGEETVRPDVYRSLARLVFDAQTYNYANMRTRHQGYAGAEEPTPRDGVLEGSEIADQYFYDGVPSGWEFADCGFVGRHPVGTDAVYSEPLSGPTLAYLHTNLDSKVMDRIGDVLQNGKPMSKVLEAAVDKIHGKPTMNLVDHASVAVTSDAASDSAKARGISVANQSLITRVRLEGYDTIEALPATDDYGYSATMDFTGHLDGLSNNLFDTLKKMFATRAGWTRTMLPVFLGRIALNAQREDILDSAFFLKEALEFLCEVYADGGKFRIDTIAGRLAHYLDPVNGRALAYKKAMDHSGGGRLGGRVIKEESSVNDIAKAFYYEWAGKDAGPVSLDEKLVIMAAYMGTKNNKARGQLLDQIDLYRSAAAFTATIKEYGNAIDYMKIAGKGFAALVSQKNKNEDNEVELSEGSRTQNIVATQFAKSVLDLADTTETLERDELSDLEDRHWSFARGAKLRDNFDRLVHLIGAYRSVDREVLVKVAGGESASTEQFLRNMAATTRRLSDDALARYGKGESRGPADLFLAALTVDNTTNEISLASKQTVSGVENLREGFADLSVSSLKVSVTSENGGSVVDIKGSDFAKLLVVYASMTHTFGAARDYVTQSTLPAVFGDALLSRLESWRPQLFSDLFTMRLLGVEPVNVDGVETYDLFGDVIISSKDDAGKRTDMRIAVTEVLDGLNLDNKALALKRSNAIDSIVIDSVNRKAVTFDINNVTSGDATVLIAGPNSTWTTVPSGYVDPLTTSTTLTYTADDSAYDMVGDRTLDIFPVLPVNENGDLTNDRPTQFVGCLEDAYNLTVKAMADALVLKPAWAADALAYRNANGKPYLLHRASAVQALIGRIAEQAVRRSPELFDIFDQLNDVTIVEHPDANVAAALNKIADKVAAGKIRRPTGARASYGAGNVVTSQAAIDLRENRPQVSPVLSEAEIASTRDAVEDAFIKVLGPETTVEDVFVGGEPANILKVTRRKEGRRTVVTYVRIGANVGENLSAKAVAESLAEYINSRRPDGAPKAKASDILAMGESNVRQLGKLLARSGAQLGESVPGVSLDFAPAMSGVINLSAYADFHTLFHEYYHQMVACLSELGLLDRETEERINTEFGGEEAAANRFAQYVTGVTDGLNDVMLRDYLNSDGEISEDALAVFERMYDWSRAFATASYAGVGPDDDPLFVQIALMKHIDKDAIAEVSDEELENLEARVFGEGTHAEGPLWPSAGLVDMVRARRDILDSLVDGNIRAAQVRLMAFDTTYRTPVAPVRAQAPQPVVERSLRSEFASPEVTGEAKVSAFIKKALTRYPEAFGSEVPRETLLRWSAATVDDSALTGPDAGLFYTARRFIRYVAAAEGINLYGEDGKLTGAGKALLASHNVAALALRFLGAATLERKAEVERRGENTHSTAEQAGADWAFTRAIETVAPASYGNYAREQARKSAETFRRLANLLLNKRNRTEADVSAANEFLDKARNIVTYTEDLARGNDIRHLISYTDRFSSKEQPYGLLFKMFTGGAKFGDKHERADGMLHYDLGRSHSNVLSLGDAAIDPLITQAYDLAAQALFVAQSGRNYRAQVLDEGKDEDPEVPVPEASVQPEPVMISDEEEALIAEALSEGIGVEEGDEAEAARVADLNASAPFTAGDFYETTVDPTSGPQWVLANEGQWLASDMMENLSGASMRDMMTDHEIRAVTESKYRLAMDFVQFVGLDTHVGDGVRAIEFTESQLGRNEDGDFAIGKEHSHEVMKFSNTRGALFGIFNWQEKRVGEKITETDWRNLNSFGRLVKLVTAREPKDLLGIELAGVGNMFDLNKLRQDNLDWYAPAKVLERQARGEQMSALDKMLLQVLDVVLMDVVKGNNSQTDYTAMTGIGRGFYADIVETLATVAKGASDEASISQIGKDMAKALERAGLCHQGGANRTVLCVDIARYVKAWDASLVKEKLIKAGRPPRMLNAYYWAAKFGKAVAELNTAASRSSYLSVGEGSNFSLAGTSNFWFHGGTGSHMAKVGKYQRGIDALTGMTPSASDVIEAKYSELVDIMSNSKPEKLRQRAFMPDGTCHLTDRELRYFGKLMGQAKDEGTFDVKQFAKRLARGMFETKVENAPITVKRDATVFDIRCAICNILVQDAFNKLAANKELPTLEKQDLLDMLTLIDRLRGELSGAMPGKVNATTELQEFERTGRLGDSRTAPEALIQMCKGLVTAERFRGCLAQMLTSLSSDGMPSFIVDPTDAMVSVNKMPDEYWGALARNVIKFARRKVPTLSYDDGLSGVENMRRIYRAFNDDKVGGMYGNLDVNKYGAHRMFHGILCHKGGTDAAGNVNVLTHAQGGEAAAYMKMLLGTVVAPTTNSAWRWFDRITSWSKISSVGFSAFFQIATAIESPIAAVGTLRTFAGMTETGAKLARKFLGTDEPFMKDLVRLLNTNDPFICEAREFCDLIGMPLDSGVPFMGDPDDRNPVLGDLTGVKRDIENWSALAEKVLGAKVGRRARKMLEFGYKHPTDYTFNVILTGVKLATVMQTLRRLRQECAQGDRPFDPIVAMRKYAAYIDAEVGGIDPARYAWATPGMRRLLSLSMFSWQWTVGAWAAGGGEAISDMLFGGHSTNSEMRQFALIRWLRMLGIVKFGIPLVMQAAIKGFATACAPFLRGGDPDDEALAEEIGQMPWLTFNNESKAGSLSFDITPILKLAARVPAVKELKKADIPVISALIPAYVGEGRNTTGKRRYYMHFGKQSDEFFRWFSDPLSQFVSKLSIPHQKLLEGFFGRLQPNGYSKGFAESSFIDRWFNLSMDADKSALWNLTSAMGTSFSWQSIVANPDAGFIAAVGPMRMGQSKRSTRLRIAERVAAFAEDDRTNNPWSYSRNRRKFNLMCTDILREAQMNGIDPAEIMTSALGDVAKIEYDKLFTAFPKDLDGAPDIDKMLEAVRALARLNRRYVDIKSNIVQKFKAAGTDIKKNREYYQAVMSLLHASLGSPFLIDETAAEAMFEKAARSTQMAAGGGDGLANFLASDEVPETLFGVPIVVGDRMTAQDRAFFKEFPEAGGYYDLGDAPESRQASKAGEVRKAYPGSLNNPGNVEKREDRRAGEIDSPHERWAKFGTPQEGLNAMADVIRQIADVKLAERNLPFTIRNYAEIYAPRKENDTDKYIRNISTYSGIDADAELDRRNVEQMSKLLRNVIRFESGYPHSQWFTDDEYNTAAELLWEGAFD